MKKFVWFVVVVVVLSVAYWLLSPIWNRVALDEKLPSSDTNNSNEVIGDKMDSMDEATKRDFEKQTMEMKDMVMKKNEAMLPPEATNNSPAVVSKAKLIARAHDVEGEALIVKSGADTFLRFENFKTINGPDLRIYLASSLDAKDFVDLGPIRATEGNVNYVIPVGTDLTKYKYAMIWCRAFSVLFSYAEVL